MIGLADTMLYSQNWQLKILSVLAFPFYTVKQEKKTPNNSNNPSISNYLAVLLKVCLFKYMEQHICFPQWKVGRIGQISH